MQQKNERREQNCGGNAKRTFFDVFNWHTVNTINGWLNNWIWYKTLMTVLINMQLKTVLFLHSQCRLDSARFDSNILCLLLLVTQAHSTTLTAPHMPLPPPPPTGYCQLAPDRFTKCYAFLFFFFFHFISLYSLLRSGFLFHFASACPRAVRFSCVRMRVCQRARFIIIIIIYSSHYYYYSVWMVLFSTLSARIKYIFAFGTSTVILLAVCLSSRCESIAHLMAQKLLGEPSISTHTPHTIGQRFFIVVVVVVGCYCWLHFVSRLITFTQTIFYLFAGVFFLHLFVP